MPRAPYRCHAPQVKLQVCQVIRCGQINWREAQRRYTLSANPIQFWLTQYDRGEFDAD